MYTFNISKLKTAAPSGIVSPDIAQAKYPIEEPVTEGRKRPLRLKSKVKVITRDHLTEDLEEQHMQLQKKKKLLRRKRERGPRRDFRISS